MKPTAARLVKITALVSVCVSVTCVAHVVSREVAYVHAKVIGLASTNTRRQELRWPEAVALPQLRVSPQKLNSEFNAE